jgi:hypothetical protein
VDLKEGNNELLFMLRYEGEKESLYARLLDPLRKLRSSKPGGASGDPDK